MTKLEAILIYIYKSYPHPNELSKARLVKLIYLADWKHCLEYGYQVSDIKWYYNHYGPFVNEVIEAVQKSKYFDIVSTTNFFNSPKELIRLIGDVQSQSLTVEERNSLDFIIGKTSKMFWDEFIRLVYSTYPIMVSQKYTFLDLPSLAQQYKHLNLQEA
jgi:hypothetical protein